jgi:hypothetical protein
MVVRMWLAVARWLSSGRSPIYQARAAGSRPCRLVAVQGLPAAWPVGKSRWGRGALALRTPGLIFSQLKVATSGPHSMPAVSSTCNATHRARAPYTHCVRYSLSGMSLPVVVAYTL